MRKYTTAGILIAFLGLALMACNNNESNPEKKPERPPSFAEKRKGFTTNNKPLSKLLK